MAIPNPNKSIPKQNLFRNLFFFIKPYQIVFYVLILLTLVIEIIEPTRPYMIQLAIDKYIGLKNTIGFLNLLIWMLVLLVIQTIAQYFLTYLSALLGKNVAKDLHIKIYTHNYSAQCYLSY